MSAGAVTSRSGRRRLLQVVAVVLIVVGLFAGWGVWVVRRQQSLEPRGQTLAEHLERMPAPEESRVFTLNGRNYLALIGTVDVFPRLPSGPPVYIFDDAGQLADWTPDQGDDEAFVKRWPGVAAGRVITQDELMKWPGAK